MKKLIMAILALAVFAPAALAANHSLKVSPTIVTAGQQVHISGSVRGCPTKDRVIVTSKAFKGATKRTSAHLPALFVKQAHHRFSAKITIKSSMAAGRYTVGARCGTVKFRSAKLQVSPGFY